MNTFHLTPATKHKFNTKYYIQNTKYKLPFLVAIFLLIILVPILYFSLRNPGSASAWFNDNWAYRKKIIVTNNTSTESNKYVTLSSFDTSDLTRFQPDCGDIRFTKENGEILPYYVSSGCATSSTSIQINFDTLVTGTQNIYLYYGNLNAVNGFVNSSFSSAATNASVGSPATEENTPAPIAFWKFDEGGDNTCPGGRNDICDQSQSRYDAVRSGATRQSTDNCLSGLCLSFDGSNDYTILPDKDQLDFTASESFTISGWFRTTPKTANTYTLLAKQQQTLSAGSTTTTTIVSNTDPGIGGYDAAWGSRTVYDPNNNRWHVVSLDSGADIHSHSTAATSGTSWTDSGIDINTGTWDYEDFGCTIDVEGTNSYLLCTYATGATDTLLYKRCTLSGSDPYISCDSEQTVYDSSVAGEGASDLIQFPRIAVDKNGCGMIIADYHNAEGGAGNLQEVWLWKEAAPCGDGTWTASTTEAGFPMKDIAAASGFNAIMGVGIKSYGNLDFQLYWIDTDSGTAANLETNIYYGETNTLGTERELDNDVEYGAQNEHYDSVTFGAKHVTFATDDGTTDLDAYAVNTLNATLGTQVDTLLNIPAGTAQYDGYVTSVVDTIAAGGDNLYVFGMNISDQTDMYYNTSTDGGATWSGAATLWIDSFDANEIKYFSSAFNRENCDVMVNWIGDFSASETNSKLINTGSCTTSANTGYKLQMESDGDLTFTVHDGTNSDSATSTAATYDDNQWHHVAAVKSGTSSIKLYIDGVEVASDSSIAATGTLVNSSQLYTGIAADGTSNPYAGFLDDIRVYRYARTQAQIRSEATRPPAMNNRGGSANLGGASKDFLTNGLVGWWKMDEASANTCTGGTNDSCDSSGNANDGAWNGDATATTGQFGYGVNFDGTGDYVSVADANSLDVAGNSMSVAYWVYFRNAAGVDDRFLSKEWDIKENGTKPQFTIGGAYYQIATNLATSAWSHIVVTATHLNTTSPTVKIYVNGVEGAVNDSTMASSFTPLSTQTESLNFGRYGPGASSYTDSKLDDVRLYNRVLSQAEVKQLYSWAPGPVVYLPLDENNGTTANDFSGNSNTGTLDANAKFATAKFGSGINFDGSGDLVNISAATSINNMPTFTASAWIYQRATATGTRLISKNGASTGANGWRFMSSGSNKLAFEVLTDAGASFVLRESANSVITNNQWAHVAVTWDGTTTATGIKFYVNGVETGYGTTTNGSGTRSNDSALNLCLASRCPSSLGEFDGIMDEVRVYNYQRSAAQIIEDMNAGHPVGGSPIASPIGYWKLDEGSGTTINNSGSQGSTLNLSSTGSPAWYNGGKFGKAIDFDGSNDVLTINDTSILEPANISLSTWFMIDELPSSQGEDGKLFFKLHSVSPFVAYELYVESSDNKLYFQWVNTGGTYYNSVSPSALTTGVWYHAVGVQDGNTIRLYLNGQLVDSDTTTGTLYNSDGTLGVGAAATNSQRFDGLIDEVKFYNAPLTSDQVLVEYNQGKSASFGTTSTTSAGVPDNSAARAYCVPGDSTTCSAPIVHWSIDENTGTSTTTDISGSGNGGTLFGIVASDWVPGKSGSALSVDETDEVIYTTGTSAIDELPQGANGMTVQGWFYFRNSYTTVSTDRWLIGKDIDASPRWHLAIIDNGGGDRLGLTVSTSGTAAQAYTTSIPASGQWFHIAGTYINSTKVAQLYINGSRPSSYGQVTGTGTPNTDASEDLVVSDDNNGGNGIAAKLDDIRIYNYVRTESQIAWDYNQGEPIAHYKFDECSGTTIYNSALSGNGQALGLNGTLTIGGTGSNTAVGTCNSGTSTHSWHNGTTGKYGSALSADGTDDYVTVSDNDALDIPGSFTLAVWIYPKAFPGASQYDTVINKVAEVGNNANYYLELNDTNDINCGYHDGSNWQDFEDSNDDYSTNTWYHIVCVFDDTANTFKIYTNGQQTHSASATTTPTTGVGELFINNVNSTTNQHANTLTDELRIYRYPLTATQIKTLYTNGAVNFN